MNTDHGARRHYSNMRRTKITALQWIQLFLGLRAGELMGLRFEDVDLQERPDLYPSDVREEDTVLSELTQGRKTP